MAPALVFGIPSNKDLTNHLRFALPFYDSLSAGDLYPGWLAESNSGYGDPSFRFYPPGLYYALSISRGLIGGWYSATLLTFTAFSILGGLGIYLWAKSVLPENAAMWASVFYMVAPYHVNQFYQATLLAEYAASSILPFAFVFVERICRSGRRCDIAGLGLAYGLLLLTHLPLAIIGSMALLAYALIRVESGKRVLSVAKLSLGAALGLGASAIYWVTVVAEIGWISINSTRHDASVDYRNNFVLSTFSADNLNVWWMNVIALMTILLFVPAVILLRRKFLNDSLGSLKPCLALTGFAVLMMLPLSYPIWYALPLLQQTQFPWRWMVIASLTGTILAAAALPLLFADAKLRREFKILMLGAMLVSVAFTLSHMVREAQYLNSAQFNSVLQSVRGSASVNYWIPIWASWNARVMPNEVEVDQRFVTVDFWKPEHRRFEVSGGPAQEARVRTFYYPHWQATSEGRALATRPDKDGALLVSLPAEAASVDLKFREPGRTRNSAAVSAFAWLFIGALALPFGRKRQA